MKILKLLSLLEITLILGCCYSRNLTKDYATIVVQHNNSYSNYLEYEIPIEYTKYFEEARKSGENSKYHWNGDWLLLYELKQLYDSDGNMKITLKEIKRKDKKFGTITYTNDFYKN